MGRERVVPSFPRNNTIHHSLIMRIPTAIRLIRDLYKFSTGNVFTTTNPKTLKNGEVSNSPTIVLHLSPVTYGVCPAAGSCAALCLNKAGAPLYMKNKLSRRDKRSHAYQYHRNYFLQLIVMEAARQFRKGYVGVRLNGTSDIAWEKEYVTVDTDVSDYIHNKFDIYIEPGVHTVISAMRRIGLQPYDYTKRIDRDFDTCRYLGYHLTLSWGGKHDDQIFNIAERYGLNVAAPVYGVKKKQALPGKIKGYPVVDGDVTDWRRDDPAGQVHIVGLRLKRTPGQTEQLARRFCII